MHRLNLRDALAGLIFILIGAFFAISTRSIEIGTAFRMGPGYFPLVLSGLLVLIGAAIVLNSLGNGTNESLGSVPWRGLVLVLAGPVVFGLTVRQLGLVPAIVVTSVLAVYASRRSGIFLAAAMAVGLTLFCLAVFSYGLRLPLPLLGPWLRF
ncbi:MAG TPA: tripartite tricarboxylate transporter TctB family protein [Aestuariivirgaceae bacterium]